jgi:glycosyltransferase involved in cell wall biosynthesis
MHILIIHQAFASFDEPGGTRHYEFARLLAAQGHNVTVIASPVSYITGEKTLIHNLPLSQKFGVQEERGEVVILRAKVFTAHHKSFYHRVIAFFSFMLSSFWIGIGVKNVDLVWGTSPPIFQGVTAWMLARLKGAKFLFEVRDLWPQFAIAAGVLKNPVLISLSEWLERFLYYHADKVMVNSPGFIDHVRTLGAQQVEVIANGADPKMFNPAEKGMDFRRLHGFEDKFVALYAGAHGISNNLEVVLDAAKILKGLSAASNIQIVFLGDGKEKPVLQKLAQGIGLTNVTFLPSIPKHEMPAVLAGTDACIAILKPLDEYKSTYPNKVFDYMAAGRPVVLVIDGVIRQVVEAAGCGLFAEPGNAAAVAEVILKLAKDPKKSRLMGLNGRKYLEEKFSREKMAEKLLILFKELLAADGC